MFKNKVIFSPEQNKKYYNSISCFKNEAGRSLTEMMGTLAIMGILAIAGIWMYHSAMDRLKANTIINEAQKRAVVVAGQIGFQGRTDPSLGEFSDNEFAGGTFSTDVVVSGLYGQFGVKVENVGKNICQNILNAIGTDTPIRRVTYVGDSQTAITSCADNNNLLLVYNNDMSTSGGDTAYAADDCGCQTVCGVCVMEGGVSTCRGECPATGTCSTDVDCTGECMGCNQTTHTCQTCQRVAYLESTGTQYINTGIIPTANFVSEIDFQYTTLQNDTALFGSWVTSRVTYHCTLFTNKWYYGSYDKSERNVAWLSAPPNTDRHTIKLDGQGNLYEDGTLIGSGTQSTLQTTLPIYLFARNLNGSVSKNAYMKCYGFNMKNQNGTVLDFVPVLDPWGVPAMYDKVNHQLYYNAGTGDFVVPQ